MSQLLRQSGLVNCWNSLSAAQKAEAARIYFANRDVPDPVDWAMVQAGFQPDPWQAEVLWCDDSGLFLNCSRQSGKRLWTETPLPTPTGWKTIGEIQVGDRVFDERGNPVLVTWVSNIEYGDAFRVRFHNGDSLVADSQHLWTTIDKPTRVSMLRCRPILPDWAAWKSVGEHGHEDKKKFAHTLTTSDISTSLLRGDETNHTIPSCFPLALPEAALPIDPYVLGAWLGNGHSAGARITNHSEDTDIARFIREAGYGLSLIFHKTKKSVLLNILGLHQPLRLQGLFNNKHIPPAYLRASVAQRTALLQGLMDTDGYVPLKTNFCEWTSIKESLALQFAELARSLGCVVSVRKGDATLNGKRISDKWRVFFSPPSGLQAFRSARKSSRMKVFVNGRSMCQLRFITSVTSVPSVPMRCITVDSPSHLYLAGESMIPTHNSTTTSYKAVHKALFKKKALVLLISPSLRQSAELFRKVIDVIEALPHPPKLLEDNKLSLQFAHNKSRIVSLPSSEGTIRGYSAVDLVIIDEASRVSDTLYGALRPMLAISQGQMVAMTTPFGRRGFFYEEWERQEALAKAGQAATRRRIKITAEMCPRISKEFLAEELETLGEWWYRQEYGCAFVETLGQLFSHESIQAALSNDVEPLFDQDPLDALWEKIDKAKRNHEPLPGFIGSGGDGSG